MPREMIRVYHEAHFGDRCLKMNLRIHLKTGEAIQSSQH
jgi:hypothetical protein